MSGRRAERVEQLLKEELSGIIQHELKDPRIGFVTVTGVKVAADMGHAKVFFTVMGEGKSKEETASGLTSAAGYIQRLLGARLTMRSVPRIEFHLDGSTDQGFRIMSILDRIEKERPHEE